MLNKLATLSLITVTTLLMAFAIAQPAHADNHDPVCWTKAISGTVSTHQGSIWAYGGQVTIRDQQGLVLAETTIASDGTFLIAYGHNVAPVGTPLFLKISYGSNPDSEQQHFHSEFLEYTPDDDQTPCAHTVVDRTFVTGEEITPTAVTLSQASILHATTVLPLMLIANAFFLTGATLFGMCLVTPVAAYNEKREGRY